MIRKIIIIFSDWNRYRQRKIFRSMVNAAVHCTESSCSFEKNVL